MKFKTCLLVPTLMGSIAAQAPSVQLPADPFASPPDLQHWTRKVTFHASSTRGKVQAILNATFRAQDDEGLGMVYDNARTRTVSQVWEDRKANCLGLTAFLVVACKSVGIEAKFAEPVNMSHWRRDGQLIRLERHVVALISNPPTEDIVADFLPQLRQKREVYLVDLLGEARMRATFYSNRAVELLAEGNLASAQESVELAINSDPTSSSAWNVKGVIQRALKQETLAEASYRKAHALDPKDGAPIGNLENQLKELGRDEEAAKFRVLSLEARRKDPYFNAFLAEEAFSEGRFSEALEHIRLAIKLMPYDPELYLAEAKFQLDNGKLDQARKSLQLARRWAQPQERERFDNKLAMLEKQ